MSSALEDRTEICHLEDAHNGSVLALSSFGNELVVSGGEDGNIKIWNTNNIDEPHEISRAHEAAVTALTVLSAPGIERIVSISKDSKLKYWSLLDKKLLRVYPSSHESYVCQMKASKDEKMLASCGTDKRIVLWQVAAQKLTKYSIINNAHKGIIQDLAFTPGGTSLISVSSDQCMKFWETDSLAVSNIIQKAHHDGIICVVIAPTGIMFASGSNCGDIGLWDMFDLNQIYLFKNAHSMTVKELIIKSDSQHMISGGYDNFIKIWDLEKKCISYEIKIHERIYAVLGMAISRDNNTLAVGFSDRSIRYYDMAAAQDLKIIPKKIPRKKPQLKLEEFLESLNEVTIAPQSKMFEKINEHLNKLLVAVTQINSIKSIKSDAIQNREYEKILQTLEEEEKLELEIMESEEALTEQIVKFLGAELEQTKQTPERLKPLIKFLSFHNKSPKLDSKDEEFQLDSLSSESSVIWQMEFAKSEEVNPHVLFDIVATLRGKLDAIERRTDDIKRSYSKGKNLDFHKKVFACVSKFPKLRKNSLMKLSTTISEMKTQLTEFSTTVRQKNEDKRLLRELELKLYEAQAVLSSKASSSELSESQISQLEKSGNYSVLKKMKETQELVKNLRDTLSQNEEQASKLRAEIPQLEEKAKTLKEKFEMSQQNVFAALPELLESKKKENELYEQFYTAYFPDEDKLKYFFGCDQIIRSIVVNLKGELKWEVDNEMRADSEAKGTQEVQSDDKEEKKADLNSPRWNEDNVRSRTKSTADKSKKNVRIEEEAAQNNSDKKPSLMSPKRAEGESDADDGSTSDPRRIKFNTESQTKKGIRKTESSYSERKKAHTSTEGENPNFKRSASQKLKNAKEKTYLLTVKTSGQHQQNQQQHQQNTNAPNYKRRLTGINLPILFTEESSDKITEESEERQKPHMNKLERVKILGKMKLEIEELKKKFSDV